MAVSHGARGRGGQFGCRRRDAADVSRFGGGADSATGAAMAAVLANATSTARLVPGSMAAPGVTGIKSEKLGGGFCC